RRILPVHDNEIDTPFLFQSRHGVDHRLASWLPNYIAEKKKSKHRHLPPLHLFILERKGAEATDPCRARFCFSFFGQFIGLRLGRYRQSVFLRFPPRRAGKDWAYSNRRSRTTSSRSCSPESTHRVWTWRPGLKS